MSPVPTEEAEQAVSHAMLKRDVEELKAEVSELRADIAGLLEAWRTATGLLLFIKWAAALATACGVLLAFKDGVGK